MKILRAGAHKRMAWKNGKGETTEIAVFPPDATLDSFRWRVSMATVAADGPFSIFGGIDRTLSILEGKGMDLVIDGRDRVTLTRGSHPYSFPADAPTLGNLRDGPIIDLNVMTRRNSFSHSVAALLAPTSVGGANSLVLVLCGSGRMMVTCAGVTQMLSRFDCAIFGPDETAELSGTGSGFTIEIRSLSGETKPPLHD